MLFFMMRPYCREAKEVIPLLYRQKDHSPAKEINMAKIKDILQLLVAWQYIVIQLLSNTFLFELKITRDTVSHWLPVHIQTYFKLLAIILKWCWASDLQNLHVLVCRTWQGVPSQPGAFVSETIATTLLLPIPSSRLLYLGAKTMHAYA